MPDTAKSRVVALPEGGVSVARIDGLSTCDAVQLTVRSSVPFPVSGTTEIFTVVVSPVCTVAVAMPLPISEPPEFSASTVTVQLPKER